MSPSFLSFLASLLYILYATHSASPAIDGDLAARPRRPTCLHQRAMNTSRSALSILTTRTTRPDLLQIPLATMYIKTSKRLMSSVQRSCSRKNPTVFPFSFFSCDSKPFPAPLASSSYLLDFGRFAAPPCRLAFQIAFSSSFCRYSRSSRISCALVSNAGFRDSRFAGLTSLSPSLVTLPRISTQPISLARRLIPSRLHQYISQVRNCLRVPSIHNRR